MLVLSRREGGSIRIDDNITVTILSIQGNQVRIGIDAPPEVKVVRTELLGSEHRAPRLKGSVLAEWSAAVDHKIEK